MLSLLACSCLPPFRFPPALGFYLHARVFRLRNTLFFREVPCSPCCHRTYGPPCALAFDCRTASCPPSHFSFVRGVPSPAPSLSSGGACLCYARTPISLLLTLHLPLAHLRLPPIFPCDRLFCSLPASAFPHTSNNLFTAFARWFRRASLAL